MSGGNHSSEAWDGCVHAAQQGWGGSRRTARWLISYHRGHRPPSIHLLLAPALSSSLSVCQWGPRSVCVRSHTHTHISPQSSEGYITSLSTKLSHWTLSCFITSGCTENLPHRIRCVFSSVHASLQVSKRNNTFIYTFWFRPPEHKHLGTPPTLHPEDLVMEQNLDRDSSGLWLKIPDAASFVLSAVTATITRIPLTVGNNWSTQWDERVSVWIYSPPSATHTKSPDAKLKQQEDWGLGSNGLKELETFHLFTFIQPQTPQTELFKERGRKLPNMHI